MSHRITSQQRVCPVRGQPQKPGERGQSSELHHPRTGAEAVVASHPFVSPSPALCPSVLASCGDEGASPHKPEAH